MIYLTYLILVPISLLLTLIAVILAPVMPLFTVEKLWWCNNHSFQAVGPVLPTWLNWFMTPDNTLNGDVSFTANNPPCYWSKVKWLWRNPAYSFAIRYIAMPYITNVYGDPTIKDNDGAKEGWVFVVSNGLFQLRIVKRIFSTSRCIYANFGWGIMSLADPQVNPKPSEWQATFVFSPRISGFQ